MTKYWQVVSVTNSVFGTYNTQEAAQEAADNLNNDYQSADFKVIVRTFDD